MHDISGRLVGEVTPPRYNFPMSWELKYNGWRTVIHVPTGTMWNRHGELLSIRQEFAIALAELQRISAPYQIEWVDAEALSRRNMIGLRSLIVLDVIMRGKYLDRAWFRQSLFTPLKLEDTIAEDSVYTTLSYPKEQIIDMWLKRIPARNKELGAMVYEGFVAKKNDSEYPRQLISPDRTFSGWIKHRMDGVQIGEEL